MSYKNSMLALPQPNVAGLVEAGSGVADPGCNTHEEPCHFFLSRDDAVQK